MTQHYKLHYKLHDKLHDKLHGKLNAGLYDFQKEAIHELLQPFESASRHLLVQAPTGSGKSRIYEEWIILKRPNRFLVVSPLVVLIEQQIEKLRSLGIRAERPCDITDSTQVCVAAPEALFIEKSVVINSFGNSFDNSFGNSSSHVSGAVSGPISKYNVKPWVKEFKPNYLVIDECHCVWMWGRQFRPEYKEVINLVHRLPIHQSLWLSATMLKSFREDWKKNCESKGGETKELGRFDLPESLEVKVEQISYDLRLERLRLHLSLAREQSSEQVGEQASDEKRQVLIFTNTRRAAEMLSNALQIPYFHAGLSLEEKQGLIRALKTKKLNAIVGTSAFGMGIDLPFLDHVVLWQLPFSLLDLAQRLGRAGRAGRKGVGLVFWDEEDFILLEGLYRDSPEQREQAISELQSWVLSAQGHREVLMRYF